MAKLQLLLPFLSVVSVISGQCSVDTCTQQCIPNQWERDLCLFYQEIATWHNYAVQCRLNVDPIPQSRPSSPDQQWDQARQYWEHLRAVWQEAANENGVFGPQDIPSASPPTTVPTATNYEMLTPFPAEMKDSGSGFTSGLGSGIQPTTEVSTEPPTEVSTTSPPPPSNVLLTQQEMWLSGVRSWEDDFAQWESFTRSESGLRLPVSLSGDIVGRIVTESGSNNERANSATWLDLLTDWNEGFTIYNTTFSGSCPDL